MSDPMYNPKQAAQEREERLKKERIAKILGKDLTVPDLTYNLGKSVEQLTEQDLEKYLKPRTTTAVVSPRADATQEPVKAEQKPEAPKEGT